ncbi:hypothetical protein AADZ91_01995 [Colwelliaceae bacterium 6441]
MIKKLSNGGFATLSDNKSTLIVACVMIIWLLVENFQKFDFSSNLEKQKQRNYKLGEFYLPQPSEKMSKLFEQSYLQYQPKVKPKNKVANKVEKPSAEEVERLRRLREANQKGVLTTVFSGNNKLELKAVVDNKANGQNPISILILVTNIKGNKSSIKTFTKADQIYGFTIKEIKDTRVLLERKFNNKLQKITLAMYKNS